jgi:hypothetical protein
MKPIFSVHAGEYLVGTHIEEKYKDFRVWLPSKDTGIDLLVTNKTHSKAISLQVKFSKDFFGSLGNSKSETALTKIKSGGWWTFKSDKIRNSPADLWILVLYRFTQRDYDFVIIEPEELLRRYELLKRSAEIIQSYVWVTLSKRCWETRNLNKQQQIALANDTFTDSVRDLTQYLNDWRKLEEKLF